MQIIAESSELTRKVKAYKCDAMRFIFFPSILRFPKKSNTSIVWVKPQSFIDLSVSWLHSIWNSFEYRAAFAVQKSKKKSWRKTFPFTLVLDETFKGNRFLQVVHPVYVFRNEVFSNGEFFDYCFERVFVPNYSDDSTLSTRVRNAIVRCFFTIYRVIASRMLQRYTYNLYSLMLYQRNRKLHQLQALVVRVS